jgi:hypothetical protein
MHSAYGQNMGHACRRKRLPLFASIRSLQPKTSAETKAAAALIQPRLPEDAR